MTASVTSTFLLLPISGLYHLLEDEIPGEAQKPDVRNAGYRLQDQPDPPLLLDSDRKQASARLVLNGRKKNPQLVN
jgi:hypothetical protein